MRSTVDTGWTRNASCAQRLDLPWTADAVQVAAWDRLTMTVVCGGCPVDAACAGYADTVNADAGFWAGAHRDTVTDQLDAVPSWVVVPLPGLGTLDGAA